MLKRDLRHIKNLAMNRVTWSLVWLCFLFGFALPHIGACVGHKQRKRLADDAAGVDPPLPKPKLQPRDGHKQRKVDHDGGDPEPSVDTADGSSSSAWRRDLRGDWAKGRLTTEQVQRYAMHSMEAGADGVSDFARMGNWGANPQNLFRAMRNALGNPAGAPEMAWYEIPTKAGPRTPHPFLLPHEFLSSFYNARSKDDFRKHIAGPVGACRQFWESMRDTAFVREHPNLAEHTFPYTIPIGMHADAGAFSKQDSIYVFNWNSLVGRGTTHQKGLFLL